MSGEKQCGLLAFGFCSTTSSSSARKYHLQESSRDFLGRTNYTSRQKHNEHVWKAIDNRKLDDGGVSPLRTSRASRPHRPHRCSRCGKEGHNVRACPIPAQWFHQRCGRCGMHGHNARNCPMESSQNGSSSSVTCRVCSGAGRLPCSKCNGLDSKKPTHVLPSDRRAVYALRARAALNTDPNESRLVFSPPLSKAQRRMADVVRKRFRNDQNNNHNHNGNGTDSAERRNAKNVNSDDEGSDLIGSGLSRLHSTAPIATVAPRSSLDSHSGTLPTHRTRSSKEIITDHTEQPCSRCMGTGYLTCMACS